jgi:phosphatidate cytidylyltransferase
VGNPSSSNLAVRLITVAIAGPLLLGLLFYGPVWGWALLVIAASGLAGHELLGMTHRGDAVARAVGVLLVVLMASAVYVGSEQPLVLLGATLIVPILGALLPLWRLGELPTAALRMLAGIAAPFYVGALVATVALLRRDLGDLGPRFVFLTLTIAWMGDTGGYTFGRLFGKHKLYEAVSPKKTREGFLGSVVFAAGATILASLTYLPTLPLGHGLGLGVLGGALGQCGDLAESLLKRSTGVKDSGALLPGHGGILDRIDALMVVAPLVYLYARLSGF